MFEEAKFSIGFIIFARVTLPYGNSGMFIERTSSYITVKAKLGLLLMWNEDDALLVSQHSNKGEYTVL